MNSHEIGNSNNMPQPPPPPPSTSITATAVEWQAYEVDVEKWKLSRSVVPGSFATDRSAIAYELSKAVQLPAISLIPWMQLPLRVHLVRGIELGCKLSADKLRSTVMSVTNSFWEQARIQWVLCAVLEESFDQVLSVSERLTIREQIWSLKRDPATGMMAGKDVRRDIFLKQLLPSHSSSEAARTYDVRPPTLKSFAPQYFLCLSFSSPSVVSLALHLHLTLTLISYLLSLYISSVRLSPSYSFYNLIFSASLHTSQYLGR